MCDRDLCMSYLFRPFATFYYCVSVRSKPTLHTWKMCWMCADSKFSVGFLQRNRRTELASENDRGCEANTLVCRAKIWQTLSYNFDIWHPERCSTTSEKFRPHRHMYILGPGLGVLHSAGNHYYDGGCHHYIVPTAIANIQIECNYDQTSFP